MPDLDIGITKNVDPVDIWDLYAEYGRDWFNEDNVNLILSSGSLRGSKMFTQDSVTGETKEVSLGELLNQDYKLAHNEFIQGLLLKKFDDYFPNGIECSIGSLTHDNISEDVLDSLLSGDLLEQQYYMFNYSDDSPKDADLVDSETRAYLSGRGFPSNIYELLFSDDAPEDSELAKYYPDLEWCYKAAYDDVYAEGAVNACEDDFEIAVDESVPEGGSLLSNPIVGCGELKFHISRDFVAANKGDILETLPSATGGEGNEDDDIWDATVDLFIAYFGDDFNVNFREPYYGWDGFSPESFNVKLRDYLDAKI